MVGSSVTIIDMEWNVGAGLRCWYVAVIPRKGVGRAGVEWRERTREREGGRQSALLGRGMDRVRGQAAVVGAWPRPILYGRDAGWR